MCVLASWLLGLPASADILVESYRDDRPADADRILGPTQAEFDKAGVKVHPVDVISSAGEQLPLSGCSVSALGSSDSADPVGQVELGTKQVFRGDYDAGLTTLEGVLNFGGGLELIQSRQDRDPLVHGAARAAAAG